MASVDVASPAATPPVARPAPHRDRADAAALVAHGWPPLVVLAVIIAVWQGIALWLTAGLEEGTFAYRQKQSYLPAPFKVFTAFFANSDSFLEAGRVTLVNAFIGFVIGAAIGFALALVMAQLRWVERSFYVYIVASQMIPVIALAPVLYGIIKDEIEPENNRCGLPDLLPGHGQRPQRFAQRQSAAASN